MDYFGRFDLQLFAGEGSSGGEGGEGGTATGVEAVDPGQQRLLELGVPAHRITDRARKAAAKFANPSVTEDGTQKQKAEEQVAAANKPTEEHKAENPPGRMTWDEIKKDPEYSKEIQRTVQARLRSAKGAEESLAALSPALEVLARSYGMDSANIDYGALAKRINDDQQYYEDKAIEMGVDVDTARKADQRERDAARQQRQEAAQRQEQQLREHFAKLEKQAEELKKTFPDFDLMKEMQDPRFVRMTSPGGGLSAEDAYYAIHRKELQTAVAKATAQATAQQISNSIQSGMGRPRENGASAAAPSVTAFDFRKATPDQLESYKRWAKSERAQGRKGHPSEYKGW